eukprot:scaffold263786_cov36-Tisochrysis_lutea.AAC.2
MCAERLSDVTLSSELGVELYRLEPTDVFGREEHPANNRLFLVTPNGCSSERDSLEDNAVRINAQQGATRNR